MTLAAAEGITCPSCQRICEVSARGDGQTVTCLCGETISLPSAAPAPVRRKPEKDGLEDFRHDGMTARGWIARFIFSFVICGVISIPLSLIGMRLHLFANLRSLRKGQRWRVYVWILSTVLSMAAAVGIPLYLGMKFEALGSEELRLMLEIMLGGTMLSMILTMAHPIFGLIAPGLVAWACYFNGQQILDVRQHMTASLTPHLHDYASAKPGYWVDVGTMTIPMKAKVVMLVRETGSLDGMQYLLPERLQARNAADVGTIAWMKWGEVTVATYEGHRGRALRRFVDVTFFDPADPKRIAYQKRFTGGDPPSKGGDADQYGSDPKNDIIDFFDNCMSAK